MKEKEINKTKVNNLKNNDFLGNAPVGKLLFKLALPMVVAQLINMLYNVVDRIFIGHMPEEGSLALTGIGVTMPIIMLISAFAAFVASGGAPRASIRMGQKDTESAEKILGNCFALQIIISIILTAAVLIWNRDLLLAFGASSNTIEYAVDYMSIYALGTIFVQITLGMNAFISAQGFTKISMYTVLIGAITNIVLDFVFIYICDFGVKGAALATIISQGISCIWCIRFLTGKETALKLRKENLGLQGKVVLPCVLLGLSTFVMQGSESALFVCFNSSLQNYGGDIAVGAMAILSSVMQFAMMPMMGIAQGATPIMSYNFGARKPERVKKAFGILFACCMVYSFAFWGMAMLLPEVFAGIFTSETELIAYAADALVIYLAVLFLMGIQNSCQMAFISLGKAGCSIIVAVVRKFVLLIPLIYILPELMQDQVKAVYMAEPVSDIIAVTFTAILFVFQFSKALKSISK